MYFGQLLVVSESVPEEELGLIPPSMRFAIASVSQRHIEVPPRPVTHIMHELIGASVVVLKRVFPVLGVREGEIAFAGRFELGGFVDEVFGEETAVVVADVGVSARSVRAVVDHFALGGHCSVGLHR